MGWSYYAAHGVDGELLHGAVYWACEELLLFAGLGFDEFLFQLRGILVGFGFAAYCHAFELGGSAVAAGAGFFYGGHEFFYAGFLIGVVSFLFDASLVFFEVAVLRHEVLIDQVFIVFGAAFPVLGW